MRKIIKKWPNHKEFEGDTIILDDIIENVKTTKQRKPRLTLEKFAEEVRDGFVFLGQRIDSVERKVDMLENKINIEIDTIVKLNNLRTE